MAVHSLNKERSSDDTVQVSKSRTVHPTDHALINIVTQSKTSSSENPKYQSAIQSLNRSTVLYLTAGFVYAIILSIAWIINSGTGFNLLKFLFVFSCFSWPAIITVYIINPQIRKSVSIIYFVILLIVMIIALIRNAELTFLQLIYTWLFLNAPGTILLILFMNRRIKADGPILLAFMIIAVTGSVLFVDIVGNNESLLQSISNIGTILGLGAVTLFISFFVFGFLFFGFFGWLVLRWIGYRYQKKRISDQSLSIDALWLLFGVLQSFSLVFESWGWIFTGTVAFVVYKIILRTGFSFSFHRHEKADRNSGLLLLRVFSLGLQSERLFETISKIWLRNDTINLIAGPDLVT